MNVPLEVDEFVPIISPIGYSAPRKTITDKVFRKFAGSDNRLPFDSLFSLNTFGQPIADPKIKERLEYVRLGPSASNKQPWRVVMDDKGIAHFYLERTPKYGAQLSYDIQMVDMGIALAHYEMACGPERKVSYMQDAPKIDMPNENVSYVMSVSCDVKG